MGGGACEEQRTSVGLIADRDVSEPAEPSGKDQRFRWSQVLRWAWEDLNLRLHPYQQSGAYRCATLRFRR
jgi:hypothetical protein